MVPIQLQAVEAQWFAGLNMALYDGSGDRLRGRHGMTFCMVQRTYLVSSYLNLFTNFLRETP